MAHEFRCGNCHKKIREFIETCPHCGATLVGLWTWFVDPVKKLKVMIAVVAMFGGFSLLIGIVALAEAKSGGGLFFGILGALGAGAGCYAGVRFHQRAGEQSLSKKKRKRIANAGVLWTFAAMLFPVFGMVLTTKRVADRLPKEPAQVQTTPAPAELAQPAPTPKPAERPAPKRLPAIPLFDGKDLSRLDAVGGSHKWGHAPEGLLVWGTLGEWSKDPLLSRDTYRDYLVRIEFSLEAKTELLIAPRLSADQPPWWISLLDENAEIIDDDNYIRTSFGTSGRLRVPHNTDRPHWLIGHTFKDRRGGTNPTAESLIRAGAWNSAELDVRDTRVSLTANGSPRQNLDLAELAAQLPTTEWLTSALLLRQGKLGILVKDDGKARIRSITVEPYATTKP